jgi:glycosyltransferase involved in cell wall biosynthesis
MNIQKKPMKNPSADHRILALAGRINRMRVPLIAATLLVSLALVTVAAIDTATWRSLIAAIGAVLVLLGGAGVVVVAALVPAASWRWRVLHNLLESTNNHLNSVEGSLYDVRHKVDDLTARMAKVPLANAAAKASAAASPAAKSPAPKGPAPAAKPASANVAATSRGAPNATQQAEIRENLRNALLATPARPQIERSSARHWPVPVLNGRDAVVTVVVPLFNEERFIRDTIDSLKRQTVRNFKAIIVDDASTDRSAAIALKIMGADPRFMLVRHQRNSGLSASRNTGLRLAETPFVTFLDGDDFLLPDSLQIRLQAFNDWNDPALAGTYSGMATAPENVDSNFVPASLTWSGKVRNFVNSEGEAPFNAHAPLLRTAVVRELGGFDERLLKRCEDWDLWQRMMRRGYFFAPVNKIAAVYRRKRASMVRTMSLDHIRTGRQIFERAHREIGAQEQGGTAPFRFTEGFPSYREKMTFAKRQLQYASMAYVNNPAAFQELVGEFPHELWRYVRQDIDVDAVVTEGLRRMLAVDNATFDAERPVIEEVRRAILSYFGGPRGDAAVAAEAAEPVVAPAAAFSHDVAFFPQSLYQLDCMLPLVAEVEAAGNRALIVTVESVTGDQGVMTALRERAIPHATYNTFVLQRLAAPVSVVQRPYSGVVSTHAAANGARVIELFDPAVEVHMPDENVPLAPSVAVERSGFMAALAEVRAQAPAAPEPIAPVEPTEPPKPVGSTAPTLILKEERLDLYPDYERLAELKDKFRGERCFIVGNGPSLNQTDLTLLNNEYSIAVNGIFYKTRENGYRPTFYVVEDSSVMKENIDDIKAYEAPYKFFPTLYRGLHPPADNVRFFLMNRGFYEPTSPSFCVPRFSYDAARRMYCGQSVTHINLQLAYHLGFSKVYLIGMDFSYTIPDSAVVTGDLILSTDDDPNHFHKDYFGKGKTWKDPKLHRVLLNYEIARDAYRADGRQIFNATIGGKLEAFERVDYYELLGGRREVAASAATEPDGVSADGA